MSSFDWRENIEDSIRNGLIITARTIGVLFCAADSKRKATKNISRCHG